MKHLCKSFPHTPLSLPLTPLPVHRANLSSQRPNENLSHISRNDQIDQSQMSRALCRVSTERCQIFNIGKGRNYLGINLQICSL